MDAATFKTITQEQIYGVADLLVEKNAAYNPGSDELQTFKSAAALQGISPKEALGGMMIKHTVSVYDMIGSSHTYPIEVWHEKLTDHMVYLAILKALVFEEQGLSLEVTPELPGDEEALQILRNKLSDGPKSARFAEYTDTATQATDIPVEE